MAGPIVEGEKSFFIGMRASLIEDERELAWAERTVRPNPALKWVLGKYVEANKANHNNQFWALDQLQMAQPSISHSPMNLLHKYRYIVGHFVDTEMLYPTAGEAAADGYVHDNPFIEALGVFYKYYFPQELALVEAAHAQGSLFYSMECVSERIKCAGEAGCGSEFEYAGPRSTTYCAHLNRGESIKELHNPHFVAGALIVPPERPGWAGASVHDLSSLVKEHQVEAERAFLGFENVAPDLDSQIWETAMLTLLAQAKGLL
jgi:hypothetical protein